MCAEAKCYASTRPRQTEKKNGLVKKTPIVLFLISTFATNNCKFFICFSQINTF